MPGVVPEIGKRGHRVLSEHAEIDTNLYRTEKKIKYEDVVYRLNLPLSFLKRHLFLKFEIQDLLIRYLRPPTFLNNADQITEQKRQKVRWTLMT